MSRYWQDDHRSHRRRSDYRSSHHNRRSRPSDEYYREPPDDYSRRSMFSSSTSGNGYLEPQPSTSYNENVGNDEDIMNAIRCLEEENSNHGSEPQDPNNIDLEKYEPYFDEFVEYKHEKVPQWYQLQLNEKVEEAKLKLRDLSSRVCYDEKCEEYIKRMEADHKTPLCRMDPSRHPPFSSFWNNSWRFNCTSRCRVYDDPYHVHSNECQSFIMEEQDTKASIYDNNNPQEFPTFIMDVVKAFQDFVNDKSYYSHNNAKPNWQWIKLKCNYKKEIMMTVCGSDLGSLTQELRIYFERGPGLATNVQTIYMGLKKPNAKNNQVKEFCKLYGRPFIRDKVGPISILYNAKTNTHFNSIALFELGRLINDYLQPGKSTVVVEIGCSVGVLSLMLASRCKQVIGISKLQSDLEAAQTIADQNTIKNCLFLNLDETRIQNVQPFVRESQSMAVLCINSVYGNHQRVYEVLRDIPTLCKLVLYGSFNDQYQIGHFYQRISKFFTRLTDDYSNDEPFMPKQTCIIDKSPRSKNLYDFVILMERKSLIQPDDEIKVKIENTEPHPRENENLCLPKREDVYSISNKRKSDDTFESKYQPAAKRNNFNGYSEETGPLVMKTDNETSENYYEVQKGIFTHIIKTSNCFEDILPNIIPPDALNVDLTMPFEPVLIDLTDYHGKSRYENINTGNFPQQRIPVSDPRLQTHSSRLLTGVPEIPMVEFNQMNVNQTTDHLRNVNVHRTTDHLRSNIEMIRLPNEMHQRVSHEDRDPRVKSRHGSQMSLEANSNERLSYSSEYNRGHCNNAEFSRDYKNSEQDQRSQKQRISFKEYAAKKHLSANKYRPHAENAQDREEYAAKNHVNDYKNEIRERRNIPETIVKPTQSAIDLEYSAGYKEKIEAKRNRKSFNGLQIKEEKDLEDSNKDYGKRESRNKNDRDRMEKHSENGKSEGKRIKENEASDRKNREIREKSREKHGKYKREESKRDKKDNNKDDDEVGKKVTSRNKDKDRDKDGRRDKNKDNDKLDEKVTSRTKDKDRDKYRERDKSKHKKKSKEKEREKFRDDSNSKEKVKEKHKVESRKKHDAQEKESQMTGEESKENEGNERQSNKIDERKKKPIEKEKLSNKEDSGTLSSPINIKQEIESSIKIEDVPIPAASTESSFMLYKLIKEEPNSNNADPINIMRKNLTPLDSLNVPIEENPPIQTIKHETPMETDFSEVQILPMERRRPVIVDVLSDGEGDEQNTESTTRPQQIKIEDVPVPPIPETVFALDKQIKESNLNNADTLNVIMRENRPPLDSPNVKLGETPSIQNIKLETPMDLELSGVNNDEQHTESTSELHQIKTEDVPVHSVIEPMPTINIADPINIKRENMIPMDEANVKSALDFTSMNVNCGEMQFGQNQAFVKTDESTVDDRDNDIFTMATPRITPAALLNHHSFALPEQPRDNFSKIDGFHVVTTGSYVGMSINNIMSESSNQEFKATDMNHQVILENTTHDIKSEVVENNDTLNTADNLTAIEETVHTENAVISDIKPEPTEETSENDFASFHSQGTLKVRKLNELLASPAPNQLEKDQ